MRRELGRWPKWEQASAVTDHRQERDAAVRANYATASNLEKRQSLGASGRAVVS